ncbi:MAG TPA: amino acid racemase [Nitrolancea sp.]|nr:amino acid racemase [Nitrolancea sp.]
MVKQQKVVGVLGGMGPLATVDLYQKIIEETPATRDQEHLHVIIESNPVVPDRSEALLSGGDDPTPLLRAGAQRLAAAGADFIVVPCNTAHAFLPRIVPDLSIPLISMIDETARTVAAQLPGSVVGILATAGTIWSRLYQNAFEREGLSSLVPDEAGQARVSAAIAGVKAGRTGAEETALVQATAAKLVERGAQSLIVACTELPLILRQEHVTVPLFDPTRILARSAVAAARGSAVLAREGAGR